MTGAELVALDGLAGVLCDSNWGLGAELVVLVDDDPLTGVEHELPDHPVDIDDTSTQSHSLYFQ